MADYTDIRMNTTWNSNTPGNIDYPDLVNQYIDFMEEYAYQIEISRSNLSDPNFKLVNSFEDYAKVAALEENLVGSTSYRFTNMQWGLDDQDYTTKKQFSDKFDIPDVDDQYFNGDFQVDHSQLRVSQDADQQPVPPEGEFGTFEYNTRAFTTSSDSDKYYPAVINVTYLLDWTGKSRTTIDLDEPNVPTPVPGDRLRFIFINPREFDSIQALSTRINGYNTKIYFGVWNRIAGIASIGGGSTTLIDTGANFANVRIGDEAWNISESKYATVTAINAASYTITTTGGGIISWSGDAYQITSIYTHAIYDLVYTDTGWLFKNVITG